MGHTHYGWQQGDGFVNTVTVFYPNNFVCADVVLLNGRKGCGFPFTAARKFSRQPLRELT